MSVIMMAGYPARQQASWSHQMMPGTHADAATLAEGKRAWRWKAATPRRPSARDRASWRADRRAAIDRGASAHGPLDRVLREAPPLAPRFAADP